MQPLYLQCASSSLQNIFFRFGEKHSLTFVLPNQGGRLGGKNHQQSYNLNFKERFVTDGTKVLKDTPWEKAKMNYSILCLHTRYDREEMDKVMGDKAYYVTMLRDPIQVFESQYSYYKLGEQFGMNLGKTQFFAQKHTFYFFRGVCQSTKKRKSYYKTKLTRKGSDAL